MHVQKWAIECIILNNPAKMMRVAYQVRQLPDQNGVCNFQVDPLVQRRVLVSTMALYGQARSCSHMHPMFSYQCMHSRFSAF